MQLIERSYPDIESNLQFDMDLLDACNQDGGKSFLRFWKQTNYAVVCGKSRKAEIDVDMNACERDGIPVIQRSSGGGTVLLGPGCLCYSLVFPLKESIEAFNISQTNRYVMNRQRDVMQEILDGEVQVQGITDLTLDGRKFSGNAQRRKTKAVLFHGTFLLDFDLDIISRYLTIPPDTPSYRESKSHERFLTNLHVSVEKIVETLSNAWQ